MGQAHTHTDNIKEPRCIRTAYATHAARERHPRPHATAEQCALFTSSTCEDTASERRAPPPAEAARARRARHTSITPTTRVHKAHDARRHQLGVHIPCVTLERPVACRFSPRGNASVVSHHPHTDEAGAHDGPPRLHATAASLPYTRLRTIRTTPAAQLHCAAHANTGPHPRRTCWQQRHPQCELHLRTAAAEDPHRPRAEHPPPLAVAVASASAARASSTRSPLHDEHATPAPPRPPCAHAALRIRTRPVCMGPHRTLHHIRIRAHPYAAPLARP
ncbi:hypothetical protein DFH09DRAFT_1313503 [Mycena vulgaris]|nr:hypothetical protein DFH09DRAFT_1313503 [Mycena vulgaris]